MKDKGAFIAGFQAYVSKKSIASTVYDHTPLFADTDGSVVVDKDAQMDVLLGWLEAATACVQREDGLTEVTYAGDDADLKGLFEAPGSASRFVVNPRSPTMKGKKKGGKKC